MRPMYVVVVLLFFVVCPALVFASEIIIAGTGDSQSLLQALARAYEQQHPDIRVLIPPSIGSTGGIRAVVADKHILGRVARRLTPQEEAQGLTFKVFGYSPVVFIVNRSVTGIDNLSAEQACAIFNSRITHWNQLGGPEQKIYLVHREAGDSSLRIVESLIPDFGADTFTGPIFYSTPEAIAALDEYPYTIGYGPLAMVKKRSMRVLDFSGYTPSLYDDGGDYPLVAPFALVWKGRLDAAHQRFVDFLFTRQARQIMRSYGVRPVSG